MVADEIGVGVIGMGWMGEEHSRAHRQIRHRYPTIGVRSSLKICADNNFARAETAKEKFGFKRAVDDWQEVIASSDVDMVCITTPNNVHKQIVEAAAKAGKHIMVEKPVGLNPKETAMAATAITDAGVNSAVGLVYRWVPAVQDIKFKVEEGYFGAVQHYKGSFFTGYGSDSNTVLSWRFDNKIAGTGALGDLMSHVIDMSLYINGPIQSVCANMGTLIKHRPLPSRAGTHFDKAENGGQRGEVTNDDYCFALAKYESGLVGMLDASRVAFGPETKLTLKIYGEASSAQWDFERMNEMRIIERASGIRGYADVQSGLDQPDHGNFSPSAGIGIGYADLKCIEAAYFIDSIAKGTPFVPGIKEMLRTAEVMDAAIRSSNSGRWEDITPLEI